MMATITQATTLEARQHGNTMRYLFRFTLDNGEVHERRAWVPVGTDEAEERTYRGNLCLEEQAAAEIEQVLG